MTPTYYKYKRLRDIGMTNAEIAAACGVQQQSVACTLSRHSTPERHARFLANTLKDNAASRRRQGQRMRANTRTTDAWAQRAADMRKSGLSSSEIGRALGVSKNAVVGALWRRQP
jgi:orotate phosphoribosyltransferase-like protein